MTRQEKLDIYQHQTNSKKYVRIHDIKEKTSRMHQNLISRWRKTQMKILVNESKLNKRLF